VPDGVHEQSIKHTNLDTVSQQVVGDEQPIALIDEVHVRLALLRPHRLEVLQRLKLCTLSDTGAVSVIDDGGHSGTVGVRIRMRIER
jgi:hypothetical protein